MSEVADQTLTGVAETLLIPLYVRAMESRRADALLRDDRAVEVVGRLEAAAFTRVKRIRMDEEDRVAILLRNREFDRYVTEFLGRHPQAVVVHIGCGLDSRFERVDNGEAEWYDLDLPEVIALRRKLLGGEGGRYHLVAGSVFEDAWMDAVSVHARRHFLFAAEAVLMYFEEAQVRSLVLRLCERFPGSELVFDSFSPFLVRANNLKLWLSRSGMAARYHWGLKRGEELERWREDIALLDEWSLFDRPEPRLARVRWMRHVPILARIMGIHHYRLGKAID